MLGDGTALGDGAAAAEGGCGAISVEGGCDVAGFGGDGLGWGWARACSSRDSRTSKGR